MSEATRLPASDYEAMWRTAQNALLEANHRAASFQASLERIADGGKRSRGELVEEARATLEAARASGSGV